MSEPWVRLDCEDVDIFPLAFRIRARGHTLPPSSGLTFKPISFPSCLLLGETTHIYFTP